MNIENKISVIMPAYNSQKHIAEAIESIISQTYTNWELLIVDDGSIDNTGKIIDEYSLKDNRIKVFHIKKSGVSHARNVALDNSTGEFISFIDSDDYLPNDALEKLFNNSFDCDLVIGSCKQFPINRYASLVKETVRYESYKDIGVFFGELFYAGFFSAIWGKLVRKSAINSRFNEKYQNGEDTLFFSTFIKYLKGIKLLTDVVYFYRVDDNNSLSHQYNITLIDVTENVIKNYIECFNNEEISLILNAYYLNTVARTIDRLFEKTNYSIEEKKEIIKEILKKDYLHKIPFSQFPLPSEYQRKASLLLIGDIDLIMDEYNRVNNV